MTKMKRTVVTGHDTNYIYPWMLMSRSFAATASGNCKMIAGNLNNGLDIQDINFMREYAGYLGIELEVMNLTMPPDLVLQLGKSMNGYFSLLFLDALEEDFIWLDSDLILNPDWERVFDKPKLNNNSNRVVICAVPDRQVTIGQLKNRGSNGAYLANSEGYFNCGMMWLSPKIWRKLNFNNLWQDVIRRGPMLGLEFIDQDVLNYLLHDHVELISKEFNYMPGDFHLDTPLITHFAGYPKPWAMSSKAKAMYFAREALNWNRPQYRPSREGKFKSEYLDYWRYEEEMLADLKANKPHLYDEAIRRKRDVTIDLNLQEKLKYQLIRFISLEFENFLKRKHPKLSGVQSNLWEDHFPKK